MGEVGDVSEEGEMKSVNSFENEDGELRIVAPEYFDRKRDGEVDVNVLVVPESPDDPFSFSANCSEDEALEGARGFVPYFIESFAFHVELDEGAIRD